MTVIGLIATKPKYYNNYEIKVTSLSWFPNKAFIWDM